MRNIASIIRYQYGNVDLFNDVIVECVGGRTYISKWNLPAPQPTEQELIAIAESDGFKAWEKERQESNIDAKTAAAIRGSIHPQAPVDEQIGILREAIVGIANKTGIKLPEKLLRLQRIATSEIAKGQAGKEKMEA